MRSTVLDASVILAILKSETMDAKVADLAEGASVSSVNWSEVLTKLAESIPSGIPPEPTELMSALRSIEPFTRSQAKLAAELRHATKTAGLSLGDRACIALGVELDADIYTADRAWAKLKLPYRIHLIR